MKSADNDMSPMPRGVTDDYLVEPSYALARQWPIFGLDDRLTLNQIDILLESEADKRLSVYGSYTDTSQRVSVPLAPSAEEIAKFFLEMSGGDVCVFDVPNSFIVCVIEGDISLIATSSKNLENMFGSSVMKRSDWIELTSHLRHDVAARLRACYLMQ